MGTSVVLAGDSQETTYVYLSIIATADTVYVATADSASLLNRVLMDIGGTVGNDGFGPSFVVAVSVQLLGCHYLKCLIEAQHILRMPIEMAHTIVPQCAGYMGGVVECDDVVRI